MNTSQIINALKQLPLSQKLFIMELVFRDMREETIKREKGEQGIEKAAERLLADYQNDEESTTFTVLDKEDFYETK